MGGGPCDFSVSPSPFGLDFGTLDFGTSDLGLTIFKMIFFKCRILYFKIRAKSHSVSSSTFKAAEKEIKHDISVFKFKSLYFFNRYIHI